MRVGNWFRQGVCAGQVDWCGYLLQKKREGGLEESEYVKEARAQAVACLGKDGKRKKRGHRVSD